MRIDADAYDGVRDALSYLYPSLSPGGFVIIDDWHLVGAQAAVHEYRRANRITDRIYIAPSDYAYTCSVGGARVNSSPGYTASMAGSVPGPENLASCPHPRTTLFLHHKHLVVTVLPQVAYWRKGPAVS